MFCYFDVILRRMDFLEIVLPDKNVVNVAALPIRCPPMALVIGRYVCAQTKQYKIVTWPYAIMESVRIEILVAWRFRLVSLFLR